MLALALGFAAVIVTTVILLGIGMIVGYQLGRRAIATPIVVGRTESSHQAIAQQLGFLREASQALQQGRREVLDSASRHRETAPRELLVAVDQLVAVVENVSQRLQNANQENKAGPANATAVAITEHQATAAAEMLSQKEMSDLTGLAKQGSCSQRTYPYDCYQTVFPIVDGQPEVSAAISVRCHEISSQSISFLLRDNPGFERLVISLGSEANPMHMEADVLHSRTVFMHDEIQTLVNCRFVERHRPPTSVLQESGQAAALMA